MLEKWRILKKKMQIKDTSVRATPFINYPRAFIDIKTERKGVPFYSYVIKHRKLKLARPELRTSVGGKRGIVIHH